MPEILYRRQVIMTQRSGDFCAYRHQMRHSTFQKVSGASLALIACTSLYSAFYSNDKLFAKHHLAFKKHIARLQSSQIRQQLAIQSLNRRIAPRPKP